MTRSEMIQEIANQAGCSKRLVRKKLFEMLTRFKRDNNRHGYYRCFKFNQVFLDKHTNWLDYQELHDQWKNGVIDGYTFWRTPNTFEVVYFTTGCNVLFRVETVDEDGYQDIATCGARLYNY